MIYNQRYIAPFAIFNIFIFKLLSEHPMDIRSLQIFQFLARCLHFSQTANTYHMSPSTLSRLIQRMEQQLDCQLLIRTNRNVQLTPAGEEFLNFVDQQLIQWKQLQDSLKHSQTKLTGRLRIFCSVTAAYSHLPELLDQFRQRHPSVEIILITGDPADALTQLSEQKVDLAIAAKPDNLGSQISFQQIAKVPFAVIAPVFSNEIRSQLKATPIDWSSIPFILPDHGPARKRFDRWFKSKSKFKPTIYATVSGHEALVSMVALGCGIAITPKVVVENSPVRQRVEYLEDMGPIQPFELGICCRSSEQSQPLVQAFLNSI